MLKTWVVVADSARARLFTASTPKGPLTEFEDLLHPEARSHANDFNNRKPGLSSTRVGHGGHLMGSATAPKDNEAENFARTLASRLENGRNNGEFEQLVLVAAPDFLGLLRKALNGQTTKLISKELNKNLAQRSAEDIRSLLPEFL